MAEAAAQPSGDPAAAPDLKERFLAGMRLVAQTVNVVTTDGSAGRAGVTVSAMSSVSADGDWPTMLVCVHHKARAAGTIIANGGFCVNILRDDQSFISDSFAGRIETADGDKFSCARWTPMASGLPRVSDPLAAFDCRLRSAERVGTHHIFVGAVREVYVAGAGTPLIYADRAYGSPARILPAPRGRAEAETLRLGALHTFGPYLLPGVVKRLEEDGSPIALDLQEGDQRQLLELLRAGTIDLAVLYDFDLGEEIETRTIYDVVPYVLLPADHRLAGAETIALEDLLGEPMVLLDAPPSRTYFLSLFGALGSPTIAYRAKSFEMVRGMVANGLGYSLLGTRPVSLESYDGKRLARRPLAGQHRVSRLVLCSRAGESSARQAETVAGHCRAQVAAMQEEETEIPDGA